MKITQQSKPAAPRLRQPVGVQPFRLTGIWTWPGCWLGRPQKTEAQQKSPTTRLKAAAPQALLVAD